MPQTIVSYDPISRIDGMVQKIPTLPSLRAFESAARHLNFTKAGVELCLSQSAISQQIIKLEEFVGAPLFLRGPQRIALTQRGGEYFQEIAQLLAGLEAATQKLSDNEVDGELFIQVAPSFAAMWLIPRLDRFSKDYPDVKMIISTNDTAERSSQQPFDVRINCGYAYPPSETEEHFLYSMRSPVCSPTLLEKGPEITCFEDVLKFPLLRELEKDGWADWFDVVGLKPTSKTRDIYLDNGIMTLIAAQAGQGIAMGHLVMIDQELEKGSLVELFDVRTMPELVYSITFSKLAERQRKVVAFKKWFTKETEAFSKVPGQLVSMKV